MWIETLPLTSSLKWGTGCLLCDLVVEKLSPEMARKANGLPRHRTGESPCACVVRPRKLSNRSSFFHLNLQRVTHPVISLIHLISRCVQADLWIAWRRSLCQSSRSCEPAEWPRVCCQSECLIWMSGFTLYIVTPKPNKFHIPQCGGSVRFGAPKLYLLNSNVGFSTCRVPLGKLLSLSVLQFPHL